MTALFIAPFVALALVIWVVVGFLIWVPLLVRASFLFTLNLLLHAITRRGVESVHISRDALTAAIGFYTTGFREMLRVLSPVEGQSHAADVGSFESPEDFWRYIGAMSLMSVVFWISGLTTAVAMWAILY